VNLYDPDSKKGSVEMTNTEMAEYISGSGDYYEDMEGEFQVAW
jgi:hypothetical protein